MSDIDLIKHYRLGQFINIPIYQCREDGCWRGNGKSAEPSNICEKGDLCIGGGSGEHPALIIKNIQYCVANYLYQQGIEHLDIQNEMEVGLEKCFIFANWSNKTKSTFYKTIRLLHNAKKEEELEFVALSIGEFVFHHLPDYSSTILKWHNIWKEDIKKTNMFFLGVSFPIDEYCGNGRDLFDIKLNR